MNFKLDLDIKKWLPILQKLQPYVFGAALVGIFAYTALVVNNALAVKPADTVQTTAKPAAKVVFDKTTIEAVKKLDVVQGNVDPGTLGTNDPFK